jgi:hypothetical protein
MNIAISVKEQALIDAAEKLQPELEQRSGEIDKHNSAFIAWSCQKIWVAWGFRRKPFVKFAKL